MCKDNRMCYILQLLGAARYCHVLSVSMKESGTLQLLCIPDLPHLVCELLIAHMHAPLTSLTCMLTAGVLLCKILPSRDSHMRSGGVHVHGCSCSVVVVSGTVHQPAFVLSSCARCPPQVSCLPTVVSSCPSSLRGRSWRRCQSGMAWRRPPRCLRTW